MGLVATVTLHTVPWDKCRQIGLEIGVQAFLGAQSSNLRLVLRLEVSLDPWGTGAGVYAYTHELKNKTGKSRYTRKKNALKEKG